MRQKTLMKVLDGLAQLGLGREPKRFGPASDLGELIGVSQATFSSAIRILESSGYITRDGAKNPYLGLTTKGERILNGRDRLTVSAASVQLEPAEPDPTVVGVDRKALIKLKAFLSVGSTELVMEAAAELIAAIEDEAEL